MLFADFAASRDTCPTKFFGLHWIDVTILAAYIIAVLAIGRKFSHSVKGEKDFFLGGRSLGQWLQFLPSFGNMTDPGQAATTASSVYRQGAGGEWLGLITLFLTPYYWFMNGDPLTLLHILQPDQPGV